MNVEALPSDYLVDFRNRLREFFTPGAAISQAKVEWAIARMNTAIALVQETEEEARIVEHQLKVSRDILRNRRVAAGITDIINTVAHLPARTTK